MYVRHTQRNHFDGEFFETSQKGWTHDEAGMADTRADENAYPMVSGHQLRKDRKYERDVAPTLEHAREYA
jgi:hypothetical protein